MPSIIGCQNSPAKGARKCELHKEVARNYVDDREKIPAPTPNENEDLLIVNVLTGNDRKTRQLHLFEVITKSL